MRNCRFLSCRFARAVAGMVLGCGVAVAGALAVEFRVAYEDVDSPDHTGSTAEVPPNPGILVEMVAQLPGRVPQLHVSFVRRPWVRCLAELEAGSVDAVFSSSYKPERTRIGVYPMKDGKPDRRLRIDTKSYSLFKRKDNALDWDGGRFAQLDDGLVAVRGYAVVDDLKALSVPVTEVNSVDSAFRMVLMGRVDGFAHLTEFGEHFLRTHPDFSPVVRHGPPIVTRDYYLMVSKQFHAQNGALVQDIWNALAAIRQAEHERLVAKYATP